MKKRILILALAAVMASSLTACSDSSGTDIKTAPTQTEAPALESKPEAKEELKAEEGDVAETASFKGGAEGYELALIIDLRTIGDRSFNQGTWEGLKKYAEENNISYKYYQPQENTTDSHLEAIGLAIEGGAKLVVCPGFLFEEPIYIAQDKYPDVRFILLNGEPHDVDYNCKTNDSVMPVLSQEDQAGFLADYTTVKDGYTRLGFMGDMVVPVVIRFGYSFVQGVKFVAEGDAVAGLEIMYNYTSTFLATPEAQSMTTSWYQNGTEVIFGCDGAVGNSVMAATQEKNARVIGVDMDQSTESETVITSAMKLFFNSMYDGIKDFYSGSFPGDRTFVFTAANNGVGVPMDTPEFEKFSQEQYDTIYKKVTDGEIMLVQFSADNNDPAKDLADSINTKVTFVEQGLAESVGCIRTWNNLW